MTRLVGVRAVCDRCSSAAAVVFCVAHRSVFCSVCNAAQHASPSASNHQCVDLASAVTALPFCEYCDDAPATTYCETESTTLCDKCDRVVHASHPDPAHCRTPISSTLRHRAVEFRGRPRGRTSRFPTSQNPSPCKTQEKTTDKPEAKSLASLAQAPLHHSPKQKNSPPQAQGPTPSRNQSSPKRRSSRALTKRKHRRGNQRASHPASVPQVSAEIPFPGYGSSDLLQSGEFMFAPGNLNAPYPPFVSDNQCATAPNDPLMTDHSQGFQAMQDRHYQSESGPIGQELNLLDYGNIDLSGDTALDGLTGSGKDSSGSGTSSRRKTPDIEAFRRPSTVRPPPNTPQMPHAPNVAVVAAAAAAAAAGEMYLLNSVSSGSGSSQEQRMSPPLMNDVNRGPDPAGVAEAATAAAESATAAAESAIVAVDLSGPVTAPEKSSQFVENTDMDVVGGPSGQPTRQQLVRRMDDVFLGGSAGPGRTLQHHIQIAQRQKFDEAVRRIDIDSGHGRASGIGSRAETRLDRSDQEHLGRLGANSDVLGNIGDDGAAEVLHRGSDVMGDLEMPGNEFGLFDSIDLSQFEQNSGSALVYPLSDYRSRELDLDDG